MNRLYRLPDDWVLFIQETGSPGAGPAGSMPAPGCPDDHRWGAGCCPSGPRCGVVRVESPSLRGGAYPYCSPAIVAGHPRTGAGQGFL